MREPVTTGQTKNMVGMIRMVWLEERTHSSAILIDRDGVINYRRDNYVLDWSQFVFIPGIRKALRKLAELRLPMILISNQSAVGRGLLSPSGLKEITQHMWEILEQDGVTLSAAYFCPHQPGENCICRKPQPELLHRAAADFGLDLTKSVFIGDSDTDVRAAHAVRCHPILFSTGTHSELTGQMKNYSVAKTAEELFDVTQNLLNNGSSLAPRDHNIKLK